MEGRWIKGFLKQKIHELNPISLSFLYQNTKLGGKKPPTHKKVRGEQE